MLNKLQIFIIIRLKIDSDMISILEDYNYGEAAMMVSEKTMEDNMALREIRKKIRKNKL